MLDPDFLLHISEGAEAVAEQLHNDIISAVIERIMIRLNRGDNYVLTPIDKWQIQVLEDAGYLLNDIQTEISRRSGLAKSEIAKAFRDAGIETVRWDDEIYQKAGISTRALNESPYLVRLLQRAYEATSGTWDNLTRTTAQAAQRLFIEQCDRAYNSVLSGSVGYTQAVKDAVQKIAKDGVTIYYPSGHKDTIETATLRTVRTGVSQASAQITDARMDEYGWDTILVSSHLGARVTKKNDLTNHSWWQGKFYSKSGTDTRFPPFSVCGMGNVQGIHGANCRHSHGPGDGENNPFKDYDSKENRKRYELEQRQRGIERTIRHLKRECMAWNQAVKNASDDVRHDFELAYQDKARKLADWNRQYKDFCETYGLKPQNSRLSIADWDKAQASSAVGIARRKL